MKPVPELLAFSITDQTLTLKLRLDGKMYRRRYDLQEAEAGVVSWHPEGWAFICRGLCAHTRRIEVSEMESIVYHSYRDLIAVRGDRDLLAALARESWSVQGQPVDQGVAA